VSEEPDHSPDQGPREPLDGSAAEPFDPAGTQPKVDRDSLLPARIERERPPSFDPPAPLPEPVAASAGPARLRDRPEPPHAARFQFILGALIAVGALAIVGLIYAVGETGRSDGNFASSWSPWKPADTGPEGAQEIADHVGPEYRLSSGDQLVLVTGGKLEVADLPMTIALRDESGDVSLVEGDGVLYRLCGLGPKCAISKGTPSKSRHLLLRREALELALYSFRYLRGVDQVVVFMPPPPGSEPDQALFFRRDDVEGSLQSPLRATLQAPAPDVANVRRAKDAPLVNRITTRGLFNFSLTQGNQDANVFLVLEPFDPAAGATEGGSGSNTGGSSGGSGGSSGGSGDSGATDGLGSGGLTPTPSDPS
jgi:hypothetical protein